MPFLKKLVRSHKDRDGAASQDPNETPVSATPRSKHCIWPPQVMQTKELGFVEDENGRYYPRDIGRSSAVNGIALYQFGDTFVHDGNRNFVEVSCSNAAIVKDPKRNPQLCAYSNIRPNGGIPVNPPLIKGEEQGDKYRTTTWCFGGVVFDDTLKGNVAEGYTYFQKSHINLKKWEEIILHTGVAKVFVNTSTNEISMSRGPENDVLFKIDEPKFGTFTAVRHESYVYAYGHSTNSNSVMLSRVPFQNILNRERYEYFNGTTFQPDISSCKPVMGGFQHGSIYPSRLFEPGTGKDWVFVGCNSFADSTIHIGVAPGPEGPWDFKPLIPAPPKERYEDTQFTYCMFAHPWAGDESKGELMVSWSEGGMKGRVVAVKVLLG